MLILNDKYVGIAKRVIGGAQSKIDVCQFKIDSAGISGNGAVSQLLMTLVSKAEEGVRVRLLLDCILPLRGRSANNRFVALWLKKRGVHVKYLPRNRCQHAKALLVDGKHVILGSHNWTANSLLRNEEWSLYFTSHDVISEVESQFDRDYAAAFEYGVKQLGL